MSLFANIQHVYATAAADLVKFGKFVETKVLPALQKVESDASTIEAVTATISPQAANVERAAFSVLGTVIKAVEDSIAAGNAGGINISLDQTVVADIKAILPAIKTQASVSAQTVAK